MNELKKVMPWVLLMIIVSGCVAIVTTVLINDSLEQYALELHESSELLSISQQRPDPVPGTYEEVLDVVVSQAGDLALITQAASGVDLQMSDSIVAGAVVTSDGWVLVPRGSGISVTDLYVAWIDGVPYDIDQIVDGDEADLLHLVDADALTPFAFGSADSVEEGEWVFGLRDVNFLHATTVVNATSVSNVSEASALFAMDYQQVAFWELGEAGENLFLVNAVGELVAVSSVQGDVVTPIHYMLPWIQASIRGEEYVSPTLGLAVSWLDGLLVSSVDRTSGALVRSVQGNADVFEVNDVLLRLDGTSIDARTPISELLLGYESGDAISVTLMRDGEVLEVLAEVLAEDLLY